MVTYDKNGDTVGKVTLGWASGKKSIYTCTWGTRWNNDHAGMIDVMVGKRTAFWDHGWHWDGYGILGTGYTMEGVSSRSFERFFSVCVLYNFVLIIDFFGSFALSSFPHDTERFQSASLTACLAYDLVTLNPMINDILIRNCLPFLLPPFAFHCKLTLIAKFLYKPSLHHISFPPPKTST